MSNGCNVIKILFQRCDRLMHVIILETNQIISYPISLSIPNTFEGISYNLNQILSATDVGPVSIRCTE